MQFIEKFSNKFEKWLKKNYYIMLTIKHCIKLLHVQTCKIMLIRKSLTKKNWDILFIYSREFKYELPEETSAIS